MASGSVHGDRLPKIFEKIQNLKSSIVNQSKSIGDTIKTTADAAGNTWQETSTLKKACLIGSATALVAPLAIIPALGVVGFTSAGVAAGSIAASMQTTATASGSIFALCQSAGAVGAVAASTSVGVGVAAGATAGGITAAVCKKKRRTENNGDIVQDETEEEEDPQGDHGEPSDSVMEKKEFKLHLKLSSLLILVNR